MNPKRSLHLQVALAGVALLPTFWALLRESGGDDPQESPPLGTRPTPVDSRRVERKPWKTPLRSEPLDDEARAEGERSLCRLRRFWRTCYQASMARTGTLECGWRPDGRFINEWELGETEFTLFVLGYPGIAESWAQANLEGSRRVPWEKERSLEALGLLAAHHYGAARSVLLRLSHRGNSELRWRAQSMISADRESGALRTAFAREGNATAIDALSYWPEAGTVELVRDLQKTWKHSRNESGDPAAAIEVVLERLDALASDRWKEFVKTALLGHPWYGGRHYFWAVSVATQRDLPWLESILREKLKQDLQDPLLGREIPQLRETRNVPRSVDEALLALASIGSPLSEDEKAYLRFFGYGCEPRKRLAEVLEQKGYPE